MAWWVDVREIFGDKNANIISKIWKYLDKIY